jgi:hypothetical protein
VREDLIRMAHEAGFQFHRYEGNVKESVNSLEALARLITSAERESIATLVEQMGIEGYGTLAIAAAIRGRDEQG